MDGTISFIKSVGLYSMCTLSVSLLLLNVKIKCLPPHSPCVSDGARAARAQVVLIRATGADAPPCPCAQARPASSLPFSSVSASPARKLVNPLACNT